MAECLSECRISLSPWKKGPVTQETRSHWVTPSPGQEAMCPCDWAGKIFCLTWWMLCPFDTRSGSRAVSGVIVIIRIIMFHSAWALWSDGPPKGQMMRAESTQPLVATCLCCSLTDLIFNCNFRARHPNRVACSQLHFGCNHPDTPPPLPASGRVIYSTSCCYSHSRLCQNMRRERKEEQTCCRW